MKTLKDEIKDFLYSDKNNIWFTLKDGTEIFIEKNQIVFHIFDHNGVHKIARKSLEGFLELLDECEG